MSQFNKIKQSAYEMAYSYFLDKEALESSAKYYAEEFQKFTVENLNSLSTTFTLEDLFEGYVADVQWSVDAELDKERSRYV
jgi:hypothetical protein